MTLPETSAVKAVSLKLPENASVLARPKKGGLVPPHLQILCLFFCLLTKNALNNVNIFLFQKIEKHSSRIYIKRLCIQNEKLIAGEIDIKIVLIKKNVLD